MASPSSHPHPHPRRPAPGVPEDLGGIYLFAILLNVAFVAVEFLAGHLHGSMGLLADAGHNLTDVGSLVIALLAFLLARRRSDQRFTYGWKKATIHASLINSVILWFAVGVIVYESIEKLVHPREVGGLPIVVTAAAGILINGLTVLLFTRDRDQDLNVKGVYLHMLADTLVSIGVVLSGLVIWRTGWTIVDPVVGLAIAAVVVFAGKDLMRDSLRLALDGIPCDIRPEEIRQGMLDNRNVSAVHHVHIWAISTTENALTAHVVLKDLDSLEKTRQELHRELQHRGIAHSTLEFETPDSLCPDAANW